jgi:hypothetical protein
MRTSSIVAVTVAGILGIAQLGTGAVAAGAVVAEAPALAQGIADRAAVEDFTPDGTVEGFADRTGMSTRGRAVYYASHPTVEPTEGFNTICGYGDTDAIVLGCYDGTTIYISDVENAQLDGIRDVTAAHEMLHAAWQRMTPEEQDRIGTLLEEEYATLPADGAVAQKLGLYDEGGIGTRINELHSIIGTEVADLSPELEAHYAAYFDDRSKVVALNAQYEQVFTDLQNQAEQLSAQIESMYADITARLDRYDADLALLDADIDAFNAKNSAYGYSDDEAGYDRDRAALEARAAELETRADQINADIDSYQSLQAQLAQLTANADALNDSIDSRASGQGF